MDILAKPHYDNAISSYHNKDYNQALNHIKKAILIDKGDFECWCIITEIYLALNSIDEASSCATTLLNLDSNNARAWHLRTRVLLGLRRYDEALLSSNKSLQLDWNNQEYQKINKNIKDFLDFRTKSKTNNNKHINQEQNNQTNSGDENKIPASEGADEFFNPINKYESIFKVTSSKNIILFKQKKLNLNIYYKLLDDVMEDVLRKVDKNSKTHIYNKIVNFAACFAEIEYESIENAEGTYSCNVIKIDQKGKAIKNIATLIHELAHHLLSEIFEISLMYLFNSEKTDAIEAFAWYSLNFKDEYQLLNEYCAHTVENYFIPFHYNNYSSFNKILNNFDLNNNEDLEKINYATKLGNTFAQDIIYMLNKYFDDNLKKEISKQFILDGYNFYLFSGTKFKTKEFFADEIKLDKINLILTESIMHIKTHFAMFDLINYKNVFSEVNKRR